MISATRSNQARFELFDFTFDGSWPNKPTLFTKFLILHMTLVMIKVTSVAGQTRLLQGPGNVSDFPAKERGLYLSISIFAHLARNVS
jgi:hypothetical protein